MLRYGGLPCFKLANDMVQPRPLGVAAVAGVFILLGLGMAVGILILVVEHLFYKYTLPLLRHKPKGTIWKSRNIMFFSQARHPGKQSLGMRSDETPDLHNFPLAETVPLHQLRGIGVTASRRARAGAHAAAGPDHQPVPEERQAGMCRSWRMGRGWVRGGKRGACR